MREEKAETEEAKEEEVENRKRINGEYLCQHKYLPIYTKTLVD